MVAALPEGAEQLGGGYDEARTGDDDEGRGAEGGGHQHDHSHDDARDHGHADVASRAFAHAGRFLVESPRRVAADADRDRGVFRLGGGRRLAQVDRARGLLGRLGHRAERVVVRWQERLVLEVGVVPVGVLVAPAGTAGERPPYAEVVLRFVVARKDPGNLARGRLGPVGQHRRAGGGPAALRIARRGGVGPDGRPRVRSC